MSKRKTRLVPAKATPAPSPLGGALAAFESLGSWTHPACLFVASALLVATPLVPSESAAKGTALPLVMLWLALLAAWLLAALSRERIELQFGWTDVAFAILLGWHSLSAVVMAGRGNARLSLNMLWTWIGFGAAYFAVRQLLRTEAERRAICAVMISLGVGLSGLGIFQFAYEAPLQRAAYDGRSKEEQTDWIRRETGIYAPQGSRQRELFESRLHSSEPLATFALTNSLAGFLAPWLMVVLGIGVIEWSSGGTFSSSDATDVPRRCKLMAALVLAATLIGACLILTKSRTAWLACAMGVPLVVVCCRQQGRWPKWLLPVLGGVVLAVLLLSAGAVAVGGLDMEVLSRAPTSVLYRVEYWRSTAMMIADRPWFGCGPGNFQDYYTTYKLPQANESIADPHNFLMEVWATAGTPAMVALLGVFGAFAWTLWRSSKTTNPSATPSSPFADSTSSSPLAILFGGAAGFLIAYPLSVMIGYPLTLLQLPELLRGLPLAGLFESIPSLWITALPLATLTGYLLWPWVENCPRNATEGVPYSALFATAITVLLVNFLAAGGIGYPGVGNSLWLLMSVALNTVVPRQEAVRSLRNGILSVSRPVVGGILLTVMGLVLACQSTAYAPVLTAHVEFQRGRQLEVDLKFSESVAAFHAAATADRYAPEPWEQLARLALSKWLSNPSEASLALLDAAVESLEARAPRSSDVRMHAGNWYLLAFRHRADPALIERAVRAYEESVERYPNSGLGHARLAWAHALAQDSSSAKREAAEALRLDALTPHEDLKLAQQPIFDPGPSGPLPTGVPGKPPEANMEGLMRRTERAADVRK